MRPMNPEECKRAGGGEGGGRKDTKAIRGKDRERGALYSNGGGVKR